MDLVALVAIILVLLLVGSIAGIYGHARAMRPRATCPRCGSTQARRERTLSDSTLRCAACRAPFGSHAA